MFTYDTGFVAHNHQDAQEIIPCFSKSAKAFGLKIIFQKTEVIYQLLLGFYDIGQHIQIDGLVLTQVKKFKFLCSTVFKNNRLDTN